MNRRLLLALGLAACLPAWIPAQDSAPVTNTVITARRMTFDYKRMIAVFEENVDVVDPQIRILCEKLTVIFEGSNQVKSVTAVDRVRLYHQDKQATADQAVYVARSGEVELTGNARLFWQNDQLAGTQINFWLNDERVKVMQPTLVITPDGERDSKKNLGDLFPVKPTRSGSGAQERR